jgi:hypothetical protein
LFVFSLVVALFVAGVVIPQPALAASPHRITIGFTATVREVDDQANLLGGSIQPGNVITGEYTYNSKTRDTNTLREVGDYQHSQKFYGITVQAGGFTFQTDPSNVDFLVEILNDYGSDNYLLRSYNNLPLSNGVLVTHIAWQLDDFTQTALDSAALPTTPPTLSDWESIFGLTLEGQSPTGNDQYFVRADVTEVHLVSSSH